MVSRVINAVNLAGAREVRVVVGYGAKLVEQVVEPMGGTCFKTNATIRHGRCG